MTEINVVTKTGKKILLRPPQTGDEMVLMKYINELVDENTMILMNEKQSIEQETLYVENSIKAIDSRNKVQLLAFDGNVLAGNVQVDRCRWKESHVGIFGISVQKNYRGDGLGQILTNKIIEFAKKDLGLEIVTLDVFADNDGARLLYKKMGFVECGLVPNGVKQNGVKTDKIMMYLNL